MTYCSNESMGHPETMSPNEFSGTPVPQNIVVPETQCPCLKGSDQRDEWGVESMLK